jgi:DNA-binding NarL/FixJ family response regulator
LGFNLSNVGTLAARVVIADDNKGIRVLLRILIELDSRMRLVGEAEDGREALALVAAERPDALLLDLSMPDVDGLQVLEEIQRLDLDLKTLVYSGFASPAVREAALAAGAADFLLKGAEPEEIVARLARLVA